MKQKRIFLSLAALISFSASGCQGQAEGGTHDFEIVPETQPTCVEGGMKEHRICHEEGCEGILFDAEGHKTSASNLAIPALGHDFQDDPEYRYPVSGPSCTQKASYHQVCSRCGQEGASLFYSSEGGEHRFAEDFVSPAEDGEKENRNGFSYPLEYLASYTCQECGFNRKQIKKGVFEVDEEEGCLNDGKAHVEIAFDEAFGGTRRYDFSLPALGHEAEEGYSSDSSTHWKNCKRCGQKVGEESHALSVVNTDPEGHFKRCSVCQKEVDFEKHSFAEPVITCLNAEERRFQSTITCACGYSESEEKTGTMAIDKEATCTEEGQATVTCSFSEAFGGTFHDFLAIPAKGHVSDHVYDHDASTHFCHCSVCGEKIEEAAHVVSQWNVLSYPSGEDSGRREGVCGVCEATVQDSFSYCASGEHQGVHYSALEPTKVTSGYLGFYYCDVCHKTILDAEHVEGDGSWQESQQPAEVGESETPYLPATLTKEGVISAIAELDSSLGVDELPDLEVYRQAKKARKYLDLYRAKLGGGDLDIDESSLLGVESEIALLGMNRIGEAKGSSSDGSPLYGGTGASFERGLVEEESSLGYARATLLSDAGTWRAVAKIHGEVLEGVTGPIELLLRTSGSSGRFGLRTSGNNSFQTEDVPSGEWTVLRMSEELVKEAREKYQSGVSYPIEVVSAGALKGGDAVEIGDCYEAPEFDLSEYHTIDNTRGTWAATFQGITKVSSNWSFSAHPWLSSAENGENNNYAYSSAIVQTNETGSEILTSGNETFGQIPFYPNYAKTLEAQEVFLLVHSNEEVNLRYAQVGDIVRSNKAPSADAVLLTSKLHKGWNKVLIKPEVINGIELAAGKPWIGIVPERWSTTIEITTLSLFYK